MTTPLTVQYILDEAIYESLQDSQLFSPVQGSYQNVALNKLTGLFDLWRDKIPFAQQFTFNSVTDLTDTNFVSVANVNYIIAPNYQTPLKSVGRDEFYRTQTIVGLNSLPLIYYFDELQQTIQVYPTPSDPTYQFVVWGRTQLTAVSPTDPLPVGITRFMVEALIYEVAHLLCARFGVDWSADKENIRQKYNDILDGKKTVDLTPNVGSVFSRPGPQIPTYPYLYHMILGN